VTEGSSLKGNLIAIAIGLVASVLLAEVALQIYNPIPIPVRGQRLVLPKNAKLVREPPSDDPKYEKQIHASTNELGFRGPPLPPPGQKAIKIFAVGGSTTECKYNADDKTWPAQTYERLKARFPEVWLNNAGLDGNSTFGHLLLLQQIVLDLEPDYVLFLIGINDVGRGEENRYDRDTQKALRDWIIEKSELLSTVQAFWRSWRARDLGLRHLPALDLHKQPKLEIEEAAIEAQLADHRMRLLPGYEARVRKLIEAVRARRAKPVLLTQPALYGDFEDPTTGEAVGSIQVEGHWDQQGAGENAKARWRILEAYNDATRRVGAELGVTVIDLAAKMPKDSALFFDWMHFSNEGSAMVGEIVANELAPLLEQSPE
jgi:lysophospholipase L1-like esterase